MSCQCVCVTKHVQGGCQASAYTIRYIGFNSEYDQNQKWTWFVRESNEMSYEKGVANKFRVQML